MDFRFPQYRWQSVTHFWTRFRFTARPRQRLHGRKQGDAPEMRAIGSRLLACCGAALALTVALFSFVVTTVDVAARPIAQVSPLSPLVTEAASSSAAQSAGEVDADGQVDVGVENAQPESPLSTEVITQEIPGVTPLEMVTPTTTVIVEEVTEESLPVEASTPDLSPTLSTTLSTSPSTLSSTLASAPPTLPVVLAEPTTMTEMLTTGQVSLVLVGALFLGLLTTIGLVLTRR